jgi:TPR repeat protein
MKFIRSCLRRMPGIGLAVALALSAGASFAGGLAGTLVAAEQGNADAQFNLGIMYDNGEDVPQDHAEAARWYRRAAEQGHAGGQFNLGTMYAFGEGVPQNDVEAMKWYRLAANQGNTRAQFNLGFMYGNGEGVPRDLILAHMWSNLAAKRGDPRAAKLQETVTKMMTREQVAEAQRLAREWKPKPE